MDKIILELKKLLDNGALSQEEYNLAISKLQPENSSNPNDEKSSEPIESGEKDNGEDIQEVENQENESGADEVENIDEESESEDEIDDDEDEINDDETFDPENEIPDNPPVTDNEQIDQESTKTPTTTPEGDNGNVLNVILEKLTALEQKVESISTNTGVDPSKPLGKYNQKFDNKRENYGDYGPGVRTIYSK